MALEKQIVDVVNPYRQDLVVYYAGPAFDIVNPLEKTQGSRFVFVDVWDPAYGSIDEQLQRIQQDIKCKVGEVQKFQRISDNLAVILFDYHSRGREIIYHLKRNALTFTPPELLNGYDIYFSKGAGPFHEPNYLSRLIRLMKVGGFFVSHECDFVSHYTFANGKKHGIPANFDYEDLGFKDVGLIDRYSLLRKVRHVDNVFEVLLPTYFGLVLQEVESFLTEFEKDPEWEIGKLIGWQKGIGNSVSELNDLAPMLKENLTSQLRARLADVNKRVIMLKP